MKKTYILDTNVLIHDPLAISKFEDNTVIIPISVIEELDKFKTHADERGRCVRIVSRKLDDYRKQGRLNEGVKTEGGGTITVELDRPHVLPREFDFSESMDNRILNHAFWHVQNKQNDEKIILVSKDINLRLKAEAVGIISQDYESGKVNIDELYRGIQTVRVPSEAIDAFYKEHKLEAESKELNPNEIVILQSDDDPKKSAVGRVSAGNTSLIKSLSPEYSPWGIHPRNNEQRWAMELLMDDSVNLVTLLGSAGTGKTLITLACGLQKTVEENVYNKLIICRPIVPVGRDIGFIPGTKEEKLSTWMGAIYDNLEIIMDKRHHENSMEQVNYLLENEKIEVASVTHIRGRSLPKQYMIVDDAQNLTPHEIKTILSRAGEGTKVVVTGDPYQIDTPYLDVASNGLTYLINRMHGQKIYGHITFSKTERSRLAAIIAERL